MIMFQTWGHRSGSAYSGHASFESMHEALTFGYLTLAEAADGSVALVGSAWARSLATNTIVLHQPDGSHPTEAGSHLASLVIARAIRGETLTSTPSIGIPRDQAELLAQLVS